MYPWVHTPYAQVLTHLSKYIFKKTIVIEESYYMKKKMIPLSFQILYFSDFNLHQADG